MEPGHHHQPRRQRLGARGNRLRRRPAYLESGAAQVQGNPDRDEILSTSRQTARLIPRHSSAPARRSFGTREVNSVLKEMGPIEAEPGDHRGLRGHRYHAETAGDQRRCEAGTEAPMDPPAVQRPAGDITGPSRRHAPPASATTSPPVHDVTPPSSALPSRHRPRFSGAPVCSFPSPCDYFLPKAVSRTKGRASSAVHRAGIHPSREGGLLQEAQTFPGQKKPPRMRSAASSATCACTPISSIISSR